MRISGLQKLSMVDYEGHISCTIFTSGCNFACPFCHNAGLVEGKEEEINEKYIFEFLQKRKNMLDAVVISGGEPTLHKDLPNFIQKIKELGYYVKLDTNGTNPEMLEYLHKNKLIDYVAMDIKNDIVSYSKTIGKDYSFDNIKKSIEYILKSGIDYEFRTTIVNEFHNEDSIKNMIEMIPKAKRYYLQRFVDSGNCIASSLSDIPKAEAERLLTIVQKKIPNAKLRGY